MDLDQYIGALDQLRDRLTTEIQNRILYAAAFTMKAEMIDRIFSRGENSNGQPIGEYSTAPIYATPDKFVRKGAFKKQGKNDAGDFKNGKPRKSMYLKDGYKELRDIQGRQTATVNQKVTGSLEKSINVLQDGNFVVIAITSPHESAKRKGNEKRFGSAIYAPAQTDVQTFREAVIDELNNTFPTLL